MTAAVAVMSTSSTTTTVLPKRHGFSIESLIGKPEPSPPSPPSASPPRPLPIHPFINREHVREDRHRERERERDREVQKEREMCDLRERQCRGREREAELLRERELVLETMREREREFRDIRDREMAREREIRETRDNRDGRGSNPHYQRLSPRSSSPPSPQTEKSLTPQLENRLGLWTGDEFKHILGAFHNGHLDSSGLYQPLRVCNRSLASMGGMPGVGPPTGTLGVGMPSHFSHLPINPLLYNLPRDLSHQPHPILAARFPGFMHARYQMCPPPGLIFHPYRKPKRNRTAFSPSQLLQLEQAFEKNHYVVGQERKTLAAKLQLTETQVKVWFQNRRTKHKRMKAEEDGGISGSQIEGQDSEHRQGGHGTDFNGYVDNEDEEENESCSDDDEEELSVTEDC